jgi:hypothetical protein
MKYEVRIIATGEIKEETDSILTAKHTAICMGNWNHPCRVTDMETGEVVFESTAWKDLFAPKPCTFVPKP